MVQEYVKPGGLLVYSTCTINSMENEENARWFAENYPFEAVDMTGRLGLAASAAGTEETAKIGRAHV